MFRSSMVVLVLVLAFGAWAMETELKTSLDTGITTSLDTAASHSGGGGGCTLSFTLPCTLE